MEAIFYQKVPVLFKKHHIVFANPVEEAVVVSHLAKSMYQLVYNVCALISAIAMLRDKKKEIQPIHIKTSLEYVKEKCYKAKGKGKGKSGEMTGGSYTIDSVYFGQISDAYNQTSNHTTMDVLDFDAGIARPALPISAGMVGGARLPTIFEEFAIIIRQSLPNNELLPSKHLEALFASFDATIKNNSLKIVKQVIKAHINCLMFDLQQAGKLSTKEFEKIMKLKRHSVFH